MAIIEYTPFAQYARSSDNFSYAMAFSVYYRDSISEFIIPAEELKTAGMPLGYVGGLRFYFDVPASIALRNIRVDLQLTDETSLSTAGGFLPHYQYTTVLHRPEIPTTEFGGGVIELVFDQLFLWDGVRNLAVKISRDDETSGSSAAKIFRRSFSSSYIGWRKDGTQNYPFEGFAPSTASNYVPDVTILFDDREVDPSLIPHPYVGFFDTKQNIEKDPNAPTLLWFTPFDEKSDYSTNYVNRSFFNRNFAVAWTELVFVKEELLKIGMSAGIIDGIIIYTSEPHIVKVDTLRVDIGHTDVGERRYSGSSFLPHSIYTNVYIKHNFDTPSYGVGQVPLVFHTPFVWDGQSNIAIKISGDNATRIPNDGVLGKLQVKRIDKYYILTSDSFSAATYPFEGINPKGDSVYLPRTTFLLRGPDVDLKVSTKQRVYEAVNSGMDTEINVYDKIDVLLDTKQEVIEARVENKTFETVQFVYEEVTSVFDTQQDMIEVRPEIRLRVPKSTEMRQVDNFVNGICPLDMEDLYGNVLDDAYSFWYTADVLLSNITPSTRYGAFYLNTELNGLTKANGSQGMVFCLLETKEASAISGGIVQRFAPRRATTITFKVFLGGDADRITATLKKHATKEPIPDDVDIPISVTPGSWQALSLEVTDERYYLAITLHGKENASQSYVLFDEVNFGFPRPVFGPMMAPMPWGNVRGFQVENHEIPIGARDVTPVPLDANMKPIDYSDRDAGTIDRRPWTMNDLQSRLGNNNTNIKYLTFLLNPYHTYDIVFSDNRIHEIRSVADFKRIYKDRLATYNLRADIDFGGEVLAPIGWGGLRIDKSWIDFPINTDPSASVTSGGLLHQRFHGVFNGNGFKLKNFKMDASKSALEAVDWQRAADDVTTYFHDTYRGLFGAVGAYGVVRNVQVEDVEILDIQSYGGALIGDATGNHFRLDNIKVKNIHVTVSPPVGTYGWAYAGGIVGRIAQTAADTVASISNIEAENITVVTAMGRYVGGLIGYLLGNRANEQHKVENIKATNVSITSPNGVDVTESFGGILGYVQVHTIKDIALFSSSLSVGKGTAGYMFGEGRVGGLFGSMIAPNISKLSVEGLSLSGDAELEFTGALIGHAQIAQGEKLYATGNMTGIVAGLVGETLPLPGGDPPTLSEVYSAMSGSASAAITPSGIELTGAYYDAEILNAGGATPLTTEEAKKKSGYPLFDWKVWRINPEQNGGYPSFFGIFIQEYLGIVSYEGGDERQIILKGMPRHLLGLIKEKEVIDSTGTTLYPIFNVYKDPRGTELIASYDASLQPELFEFSTDGSSWQPMPRTGAQYTSGEEQIRTKFDFPPLARFFVEVTFYSGG